MNKINRLNSTEHQVFIKNCFYWGYGFMIGSRPRQKGVPYDQ